MYINIYCTEVVSNYYIFQVTNYSCVSIPFPTAIIKLLVLLIIISVIGEFILQKCKGFFSVFYPVSFSEEKVDTLLAKLSAKQLVDIKTKLK